MATYYECGVCHKPITQAVYTVGKRDGAKVPMHLVCASRSQSK